jgi:hypothetical protein
MAQFQAWHGKILAEHEALRDQWAPQGYRFVSLSIYGAVNASVRGCNDPASQPSCAARLPHNDSVAMATNVQYPGPAGIRADHSRSDRNGSRTAVCGRV